MAATVESANDMVPTYFGRELSEVDQTRDFLKGSQAMEQAVCNDNIVTHT